MAQVIECLPSKHELWSKPLYHKNKTPRIITEVSKIQVNIQKLIASLYASNNQQENVSENILLPIMKIL
jgi:hypothetical protein